MSPTPVSSDDSPDTLFVPVGLIDRITSALAILAVYLKLNSRQNLNSPAVILEDACAPLLNLIYGLELSNLNAAKANFPAADLICEDGKVAYQITVDDAAKKITNTNELCRGDEFTLGVETLTIFFFVDKAPAVPKALKDVLPGKSPAINILDLTALITKIRSLELDHIRKVAELLEKLVRHRLPAPRILHLPLTSLGNRFIGRTNELGEIHTVVLPHLTRLAEDPNAVEVWPNHIIRAYGGMGKTRLVYEYAHKHQSLYRAALGISLSSAADLDTALAGLADHLGLGLPKETDIPTLKDHVLQWFKQHAGWLLIIDNVDDPEALPLVRDILPALSRGHVLITTRLPEWDNSNPLLKLDYLSPDQAVALLEQSAGSGRRLFPATDEADGKALAESLDYLCLALEVAGLYIGNQHITYATYQALMAQQPKYSLTHGQEHSSYHQELTGSPKEFRSIWMTWRITFAVLSPPARLLLEVLSWFAPAPLPERLFHPPLFPSDCATADDPPPLDLPLGEFNAPPKAVTELRAYGFLLDLKEECSRRVPTLLQVVLRGEEETQPHTNSLPTALMWINEAFDEDASAVDTLPILVPLIPHTLDCASHAEKQGIADPTTLLLNQCGLLLVTQAQYKQAEDLYRRALRIDEKALGKDNPAVARSLNNLAHLLHLTDRMAEAESLMRRSLAINEVFFKADHPVLAIDLNNLAELLKTTNRAIEAEPLLRRVLEIAEGFFGPDHPWVAKPLSNLADLLLASNRMGEAESFMRRALAINEASLGADHSSTAIYYNNLAQLLKATNRLAEAEPLMRRALDIDEASLGPHHPTVARDLNNLAGLLKNTNRMAEAEPMMHRALAIDESSLGPDHTQVALRLNSLAALYSSTNRVAEAEPMMRRALTIQEASFGSDHPLVALQLHNLAHLLHKTNRLVEAEPLMRRALAIVEASLGPNHPNVANNLSNLAQLLQDTARLDEAEPLMLRALNIDEASLGPSHPDVAIRLNNLATLLLETNRTDQAESLMRRALAINEESLEPCHPNVATHLNNLAMLFKDSDRLKEAEPLMLRALEIDESSFGPDHPKVAGDLNHLATLYYSKNSLVEAEPLLRRALSIFEQSLGAGHPSTLRLRKNLAILHKRMGK